MKKNSGENFLEKIPALNEDISYKTNDEGIVTLAIKNKGFVNFLAQKLFFKPDTTYIHLDELGSFSVLCMDGERDIIAIGELVNEKFGEKAEPLYERLAKFFQIMASYKFIKWK